MTSKIKYLEAAIAAGAGADSVVELAERMLAFCEKGPARVSDNVTCAGPGASSIAIDMECVYLAEGMVVRDGKGQFFRVEPYFKEPV